MSLITDFTSNLKAQIKAFPGVPQPKGSTTFSAVSPGGAIAKGASTIASNLGKAIVNNPIKSAIVGLVGGSAIVENPKIVTQGIPKTVSGLSNVGTNIGEFSKAPSLETAQTIFKENPIISTALTGGALFVAGAGVFQAANTAYNTYQVKQSTSSLLNAQSSYKDYAPINNIYGEDTYKKVSSAIAEMPGSVERSSIITPSPAAANYPEPNTQLTSYTEKRAVSGVKKPRKAQKPQNINIRNNILIANKG